MRKDSLGSEPAGAASPNQFLGPQGESIDDELARAAFDSPTDWTSIPAPLKRELLVAVSDEDRETKAKIIHSAAAVTSIFIRAQRIKDIGPLFEVGDRSVTVEDVINDTSTGSFA